MKKLKQLLLGMVIMGLIMGNSVVFAARVQHNLQGNTDSFVTTLHEPEPAVK